MIRGRPENRLARACVSRGRCRPMRLALPPIASARESDQASSRVAATTSPTPGRSSPQKLSAAIPKLRAGLCGITPCSMANLALPYPTEGSRSRRAAPCDEAIRPLGFPSSHGGPRAFDRGFGARHHKAWSGHYPTSASAPWTIVVGSRSLKSESIAWGR